MYKKLRKLDQFSERDSLFVTGTNEHQQSPFLYPRVETCLFSDVLRMSGEPEILSMSSAPEILRMSGLNPDNRQSNLYPTHPVVSRNDILVFP
jgi:hypothetical protein